jgi:hypothetical protein
MTKDIFETGNSAEVLSLLYRMYNKHNLPLPTFIVYNGFDEKTCRALDAGGLSWQLHLDMRCTPDQMEARGLVTGLVCGADEVPEFPGAYWLEDAVGLLLGDGRWLYAEAIFDGY